MRLHLLYGGTIYNIIQTHSRYGGRYGGNQPCGGQRRRINRTHASFKNLGTRRLLQYILYYYIRPSHFEFERSVPFFIIVLYYVVLQQITTTVDHYSDYDRKSAALACRRRRGDRVRRAMIAHNGPNNYVMVLTPNTSRGIYYAVMCVSGLFACKFM